MASIFVSVSQLKTGERINQDVFTQRGGILFAKGKLITQREIDILKAFFIQSVSIESESTQPEEQTKPLVDQNSNILQFYSHYNQMLVLLKRVFNLANSGSTIPILDIRTSLESLILFIDHYNTLTFTPRNMIPDEYMYHNSIKVSLTSYILAKWHGFAQKDLMPIALSGLFHDIGNVKIDSAILYKPGKLSAEELEQIRKHTIFGYNILKSVPAINEGVKLAALQHHEKEDGTGYPMAVKGDKIHIYAKIVAIADIFHAATTHRIYKKAASPYLILDQIARESFGKLEPSLVQTFINKVTQFHNGTVVKLSDDSIGEIVFSDRMNPTRPWVNVNGNIINLTIERNLFIQEVIKNV